MPKKRSATLNLTAEQESAVIEAIRTAVDEMKQYIGYGNPRTDYGKEWPEVRASKVATLKTWQEIALLCRSESTANECRIVAATYRGTK